MQVAVINYFLTAEMPYSQDHKAGLAGAHCRQAAQNTVNERLQEQAGHENGRTTKYQTVGYTVGFCLFNPDETD